MTKYLMTSGSVKGLRQIDKETESICPLCKKKCFPSKYYCADCNNEFES